MGSEMCIRDSPKFEHPTVWVNHFHFVFFKVQQKHENRTFRASLNPLCSRDLPCIQERQILFRIALTRALYDQIATQLCPFYVPGKFSFSSLVVFGILAPFGFEEITTGKTVNTRCLRSGHKTNWSLAFEALPVFPVVIFRHI